MKKQSAEKLRVGFRVVFRGGKRVGELVGKFSICAGRRGGGWAERKKRKFSGRMTRSIKQIKKGVFLRCGGKKKKKGKKHARYSGADDA